MTEPELDRIVASVRHATEHERLYRDLIRRSGIAVSAAESWALWQIAAHGPITMEALAGRLGVDPAGLGELFQALGRRGYLETNPQGLQDLTADGRHAFVALVRAGQDEVARLIRGREPDEEHERTRVLARLTRAALARVPAHGVERPRAVATCA